MIEFRQCEIAFSDSFSLKAIDWVIKRGDVRAIIGPNGSGKSALVASLAGEGRVIKGQRVIGCDNISLVSLEEQGRLIDREKARDDSDLTDEVDRGTSVAEMLDETCVDKPLCLELVALLSLEKLLDRGFRDLSTGETRKLMLIRALCGGAELIAFDEPFEGLDALSALKVEEVLARVSGTKTLVLAFNRFDEIPNFVSHILYLEEGSIKHEFTSEDNLTAIKQTLSQLQNMQRDIIELPSPEISFDEMLNQDGTLVRLTDVRVAYTDNIVFEGVNWAIYPGEHWQVMGPNGSGKTCLLRLLSGDHPQCYVNDISLFGFQRGSGETIWQIKHYLGFVSTALHWDYRLSVGVRNVVVSGFYDSIGLYQKATEKQIQIANEWLALLGMSRRATDSFSSLSFGEQRLVLIARAMVKHPPLLMLDEPCLGLDDLNRELVLTLIQKICDLGSTTVIYVTHHKEDEISTIQNKLSLS